MHRAYMPLSSCCSAPCLPALPGARQRGDIGGGFAHHRVRAGGGGVDSHISVYEQGGVATLGSVHPRTVVNKADGTMDLKKVELAISAPRLSPLSPPFLNHSPALPLPPSVMAQVRGSEVILGADSHISVYEQGGVATLGSVHPRTVVNKADGTMDLKKVELAIRKDDEHYPVLAVIDYAVLNLATHMRHIIHKSQDGMCRDLTLCSTFALFLRFPAFPLSSRRIFPSLLSAFLLPCPRCGGRAITVDYTERLAELASWYGLKFHIDGARIFNAAVALRVPVDRLVRPAHSVSVCLSKGLGAPAGSVIVGSMEFIAKARRLRKALGGSMRQVGVLAAAGLVALQESVPRLIRDHQRAMQLAEGLDTLDGLAVDVSTVDSNIVTMDVKADCPIGAEELCNALRQAGVLTTLRSNNKIRMVTHYHITAEDIRYTLACTQVHC
ncbi:unnamed protein product [Closterium sp. NIES-65]|nr:unnamed protein product [Closterium sp. NIES-65]